ncbi:MAG TPA: L,D-transpeptidase family protein, partial [Acidimicrobiales bacterium]
VTGCGGGPAAEETASAPDTTATTSAAAGQASGPAGRAGSVVARTDSDREVYAAPGDTTAASVLPATTEFGSPRALQVLGTKGEWLQVALPVRPNGSTGWIPRSAVELRDLDEAIEIDLAARTLTLYDGGDEVLTTPVAIGTDTNPTPTGHFYVVDKLDTGDPQGPYGQFAYGLSAHSPSLTEFAGGDGQVGIHGTNDPASIGQAVSHGCVRVPNDIAAQLAGIVNLGTPVTIT